MSMAGINRYSRGGFKHHAQDARNKGPSRQVGSLFKVNWTVYWQQVPENVTFKGYLQRSSCTGRQMMALSYKTHLTTTIKSQTGWSNHSSNLVFFSLIFSLIPDFACSYFCRTWKICCWKMVSRIVLNGSLPCMSLSDHFNPKFFFQQWLLSDRRICSVLVGQRVQSFVRACDKQRSLIKLSVCLFQSMCLTKNLSADLHKPSYIQMDAEFCGHFATKFRWTHLYVQYALCDMVHYI